MSDLREYRQPILNGLIEIKKDHRGMDFILVFKSLKLLAIDKDTCGFGCSETL